MDDHLESDKSERYEHDALNRLTKFERGALNGSYEIPTPLQDDVLPGVQEWTLDRRGNWSSHAGTIGATTPSTTTETRTPNEVNEIADLKIANKFDYEFEYDSVGNLTRVYNTLGDMNCDYSVDAYDIDAYISALLTPAQYAIDYPGCDIMRADVNGDGQITAFDTDPFISLVLSGGAGFQPNTEFVYDEENRLLEVNHIGRNNALELQQSYAYDALGRRIETIDQTATDADDPLGRTGITEIKTRHIYAGLETIEEYVENASSTWTLVREFIWGGGFPELLAMIDRSVLGDDATLGTPEVLYTLHDPLGSVIGLVNDSGTLVEKVHYDPYGQTYFERYVEYQPGIGVWYRNNPVDGKAWGQSAYGLPFLWTGQRYDEGVELYAFLYRTYSPRLGRWLQRDPAGYVDGVGLNEYVAGSPLRYVDPLGESGQPADEKTQCKNKECKQKTEAPEKDKKDKGDGFDAHARYGGYFSYTLDCSNGGRDPGKCKLKEEFFTHNVKGAMLVLKAQIKSGCCIKSMNISTHHSEREGLVYSSAKRRDEITDQDFIDSFKGALCKNAGKVDLNLCNSAKLAEGIKDGNPDCDKVEIEYTKGTNYHWPGYGEALPYAGSVAGDVLMLTKAGKKGTNHQIRIGQ